MSKKKPRVTQKPESADSREDVKRDVDAQPGDKDDTADKESDVTHAEATGAEVPISTPPVEMSFAAPQAPSTEQPGVTTAALPSPAQFQPISRPAPKPSMAVTAATVVKPVLNNAELESVVNDALRQTGDTTIVVQTESDRSAVYSLLSGSKKSIGVKVKPSQSVRALWRTITENSRG